MKKIIITIMFILTLLIMTACGDSSDSQGAPEDSVKASNELTSEASDELTFTIDDTVLTFDTDAPLNNLNYKTSSWLRESWGSYNSPIYLDLIYEAESYFSIHLEYDAGTLYDYTDGEISDLSEKKAQTVEINDITWYRTESKTEKKENIKYWYVDDEGVYNIGFHKHLDSPVDLDELARVFMSGVTIRK